MRLQRPFSLLVCLVLALVYGISSSAYASPAQSQGPGFDRATAGACPRCEMLDLDRRDLGGGIAEYSFTVRVGAGEHDLIRLHRVVKERAPFIPARTRDALFMAHGDVWGFDAAFLGTATPGPTADGDALPVYLAARGVDVWGIDFRWTLVPASTADLSFMGSWGIETDAGDLRLGMAIARLTRALGGDGFGRMILLGWSRGAQVGYAALDAESQLPPGLRQIKAFIPTDVFLKSDQPDLVAAACLRLGITQAQQGAGLTADATGSLIAVLGQLAAAAPAAPSPIFPGLSNRQAALLAGSATFQLLPPGGVFVPFYHFAGGTFDAFGLPDGLLYQDEPGFFTFLAGASPYEPLRVLADGDAATCESSTTIPVPDVGFDDHLGSIHVPILYVGAGGGFGDYGVYTTSLLGSSDVSTLVVSLLPPSQRLFDLGHADIFHADDAASLFWSSILDWIRGH